MEMLANNEIRYFKQVVVLPCLESVRDEFSVVEAAKHPVKFDC